MKKCVLFFSCILLLVFLSGCEKDKVDMNEVLIPFSVDTILKNRLQLNQTTTEVSLTNDALVSEGYYRLVKAFAYIDDLIWNINYTIENSTFNQEVNENETVMYEGYESKIIKDNNRTKLTINNSEINQKLVVEKYIENDQLIITGSNQVNNNSFTFKFINNEELFIDYYDEPHKSDSYAHFIEENDELKGVIVFNNSVYDYNLYTILNDEYGAIYYDYASKDEENHVFEVYDHNGQELYVALSLKNGMINGSGWHLNALSTFDESEKQTNQSFHTIKKNYLNQNLERVMKETVILGDIQSNHLWQIVSVPQPFQSIHYQPVLSITQKLNSYYKTQINK